MILGIDEVGRGAWAGPLVVGACILNNAQIDGLTVNIMIDYSDGKIIQINPVIKPRIKEFYQKIIHLLLIKNKEKNNQKILFKIEKYN